MTQDLKIYAANASAFALSMSNIDSILKITLLAVSIGYTVQRWYLMNKNEKDK